MSVVMEPLREVDLEAIPTLPSEPWREALLRAVALIKEKGWVQGCSRNPYGYCLVGSVIEVLNTDAMLCSDLARSNGELGRLGVPPFLNNPNIVHKRLGGGMETRMTHNPDGTETIMTGWRQAVWNDVEGRTKDEVIAVLRRLADGATWDEATA